ncbi:MAG: rRNA maturation RNase YbeY [Pseudomonadota bacterium]
MASAASRRPRFRLAVQYATGAAGVPGRGQFRRWVAGALKRAAEITIRVVDEPEGRELNRAYRRKDYATNVLTFAYRNGRALAGDLVLCAPVVEREARARSKALRDHYAHLTVHGVLHLQGYDHEADADAGVMEALETRILRRFRIADPYAAGAGGQIRGKPRKPWTTTTSRHGSSASGR